MLKTVASELAVSSLQSLVRDSRARTWASEEGLCSRLSKMAVWFASVPLPTHTTVPHEEGTPSTCDLTLLLASSITALALLPWSLGVDGFP